MEQNQYVEYLLHFGLTRQEALIYVELLVKGKQTGYEIAKETGISRSNVYSVLAALEEKGAAYVIEESAKRYIPVKVEEFCGNCIRRMHPKWSAAAPHPGVIFQSCSLPSAWMPDFPQAMPQFLMPDCLPKIPVNFWNNSR